MLSKKESVNMAFKNWPKQVTTLGNFTRFAPKILVSKVLSECKVQVANILQIIVSKFEGVVTKRSWGETS